MCLAVPGQVTYIDERNPELRMAKVDFAGVQKDICIQWLPEVQVGDYIIAHVGLALNKVDENEALETLALLKEMGETPGEDEIRQ